MGRLISRRDWLADVGTSALIAAAICGPLLISTGFWLAGDMVFVPRQPWKPEWLGLDGTLPRAVPGDAVISLLTTLLPGWVVQRLMLIGGFMVGGVGIGRLVRTLPSADAVRRMPWAATTAAIVFFLWNPWVHERLMIGQWAILVGYFVLPWVAVAALGVRSGPPAAYRWAGLYVALLACAVASPAPGLFAAVLAWCLAATRSLRRVLGLVAVTALANVCWVAPAMLATSQVPGGEAGFAEFAPAAESPAGLVASLLSLGGIWKTSIVASERTVALIVVVSCLLSLAACWGLWSWARCAPGVVVRLALPGVLALLYAWFCGTSVGAHAVTRAAELVPPLAMLRDSHRVLALWALVLAVGLAECVRRLLALRAPGRESLTGVLALVMAGPIVLLPSLAWGAAGELRPVHYPDEWHEVSSTLGQDPGRVVVLPWTGSYRGFAWAHRRAMLDPAPRFFAGQVLVDDRVLFGSQAQIASEDPLRARVYAALRQPSASQRALALQQLGVGWVLVEKGLAGSDLAVTGTVAHDGDELQLIRLPSLSPGQSEMDSDLAQVRRVMIEFSHVSWVMGLLLSLGLLVHHITRTPR